MNSEHPSQFPSIHVSFFGISISSDQGCLHVSLPKTVLRLKVCDLDDTTVVGGPGDFWRDRTVVIAKKGLEAHSRAHQKNAVNIHTYWFVSICSCTYTLLVLLLLSLWLQWYIYIYYYCYYYCYYRTGDRESALDSQLGQRIMYLYNAVCTLIWILLFLLLFCLFIYMHTCIYTFLYIYIYIHIYVYIYILTYPNAKLLCI